MFPEYLKYNNFDKFRSNDFGNITTSFLIDLMINSFGILAITLFGKIFEIKSLSTDYDSVISATYGLPLVKNDNKKLNNNNAQTINKQPLIYSNQNNKPSDIQTLDISSSSSSESSYISNTLLDLLFDLDIQGNMASI